MLSKLLFGSLFFVCGLSSAVSALASGSPRFERIQLEDGLSQSTILSMAQDTHGFVWFATQDGLNRYDGYQMRMFRPIEGDLHALTDNFISVILPDDLGGLWVGTRNGGLNHYNDSTESFEFLAFPQTDYTTAQREIHCIMRDRLDRLWVGTNGGLLRAVDDGNRVFKPVAYKDGLDRLPITSLFEDRLGAIWIGTQSQGVFRCFQSTVDAETRLSEFGPLPGVIKQFAEDPQGNLWAVGDLGTFVFPLQGTGFQRPSLLPESIANEPAEALMVDEQNNIWLGTIAGGAVVFPCDQPQSFNRYQNLRADPASLSNNWVHCLAKDRSGSIWIGTASGACRLNANSTNFEVLCNRYDDPTSLVNNHVFAIVEDDRDGLWLGARGGGLSYTSKSNPGKFVNYPSIAGEPTSLISNNLRSLAFDDRGYIWIGTENNGLDRMSLDEPGVFKHFQVRPGHKGSLSHNVVRGLLFDSGHRLWAGTDHGVNLLDSEASLAGQESFFVISKDGPVGAKLSHNKIRALLEDPSRLGTIWVATAGGGLNRLNHNKGEVGSLSVKSYPLSQVPNQGPSHGVVISLCLDAANKLWFGTPNGLNRFDPETEQFTYFKEGLPNNVVYAVLFDGKDKLWLSTNHGLSAFDIWNQSFKNFDARDGLAGNEFNAGSSHKSLTDGKLYFGGTDGLTSFYSNQIRDNPFTSEVVLTDLLLFNLPVPIQVNASDEESPSPLKESITTIDHLNLRYDDTFKLIFSALHYSNPGKNQFAYELSPFDKQWVHCDALNRSATYTSLSPGNYLFRVKASNKDGIWSKTERTLQITIKPPLWRTSWAYLFYFLLAIGLVALIYRLHLRQLSVERLVVERLRHIDHLKDEFLANTSHELRTPLNGMIGIAESLLDRVTEEELKQNLNLIVSSGRRLTSLVNDILDFSKLRVHELNLNLQGIEVFSLVDVVITLMRPLIKNPKLELINAIPKDLPYVLADENRLQQILHNLIGNALKFTSNGKVIVSATKKGTNVWLHVSDTGIGIDESKLEDIFGSFVQGDGASARTYGGTGLGLAITKQLVELHGGQIKVKSKLARGSVFSFSLKVSQEKGSFHEVRPVIDMELDQNIEDWKVEGSEVSLVSLPPDPEFSVIDGGWHVLIVDDEAVNRLVLHNHLTHRHFKVSEATNGVEALSLFQADPSIDLVLLDIMMPKLSGYEVCRILRATHSSHELPIIFLSARNQVEDIAAGFLVGGNDYLPKPFSKEELMVRISHHLSLLHAGRSLKAKGLELMSLNQQLVAARNQLVISEKMVSLGALTAGISHELNNPAGFVHGSIQNLENDLVQFGDFLFEVAGEDADPEVLSIFKAKMAPLFEHLDIAAKGTQRIRDIAKDLNTFAKGEGGRFDFVPLTEGISSTLNLVRANYKDVIRFECHFEDPLYTHCRPAQMNQVYMNLIVNGCLAILEAQKQVAGFKGLVTIETRKVGEMGVITIQDNGVPLSESEADRVFDSIYEGKRKGLGLSHDIVVQHGGQIEWRSSPESGTCFTMSLPIVAAETDHVL